MRTISQVTEEVIRGSPFFSEVLVEGVANNAELARKIRPEVERRLYERVSEVAISMALHRLKKRLRLPHYGARFLKQIRDLTLRSGLIEFVCPNSANTRHIFENLSRTALKDRDTFFNFSRGLHESLVIVNEKFEPEVLRLLRDKRGVRRLNGLSAITMRLPELSLDVPGVYYPILQVLALEGISFIEVMSVRTEFSIIFKDVDVDRAFSVLKRLTS